MCYIIHEVAVLHILYYVYGVQFRRASSDSSCECNLLCLCVFTVLILDKFDLLSHHVLSNLKRVLFS